MKQLIALFLIFNSSLSLAAGLKVRPVDKGLKQLAQSIITLNGAQTLKLKEIKKNTCKPNVECTYSIILSPGETYEVVVSDSASESGWLKSVKNVKP